MQNHKSKVYVPAEPITSPFGRSDKRYDAMISDDRKEKVFLRIVILFLLTIIGASVGGWVHIAKQQKHIPMVIEVAPWGEAVNLGDISKQSYGTINVPEAARQWQVRDFVKKLRSLPDDPQILYDNVSLLFSMITRSVEEKVKKELREPDIFSFVGKKNVTVLFESTIRVSDKSYQIDWIETTTGEGAGKRRYRGVFTLEFLTPSKKQLEINPLGIFIKDYDIAEITEVKK